MIYSSKKESKDFMKTVKNITFGFCGAGFSLSPGAPRPERQEKQADPTHMPASHSRWVPRTGKGVEVRALGQFCSPVSYRNFPLFLGSEVFLGLLADSVS